MPRAHAALTCHLRDFDHRLRGLCRVAMAPVLARNPVTKLDIVLLIGGTIPDRAHHFAGGGQRNQESGSSLWNIAGAEIARIFLGGGRTRERDLGGLASGAVRGAIERHAEIEPDAPARLARGEDLLPGGEAAGVDTAQGGGGVDANIDRWIGQFKQADGSSSKDAARRSTQTVHGMTVHLVDVAGSYDAGAAMMGNAPAGGEQRMLGAIVEAPTGLFFFKLLGDPETIASQESAFSTFVQSMKPGQATP